MNENLLVKKIKTYETEYISFMNLEKFPDYEIDTKKVSLAIANKQGYEAVATTWYLPQTGKHTLIISTNIIAEKQLLFHEFTHMLDAERYVNGDKMRYAWLSGYTEYHASQIELMQMLGVKNINAVTNFSMNDTVTTLAGEKKVAQYVADKRQHAISLFERNDFPADLATLKTAIGVLYNYWGLRSICELYSDDYVEIVNNNTFLQYISTQIFCETNNLMHGWLNTEQIEYSMKQYMGIIFPLAQKYKLI